MTSLSSVSIFYSHPRTSKDPPQENNVDSFPPLRRHWVALLHLFPRPLSRKSASSPTLRSTTSWISCLPSSLSSFSNSNSRSSIRNTCFGQTICNSHSLRSQSFPPTSIRIREPPRETSSSFSSSFGNAQSSSSDIFPSPFCSQTQSRRTVRLGYHVCALEGEEVVESASRGGRDECSQNQEGGHS